MCEHDRQAEEKQEQVFSSQNISDNCGSKSSPRKGRRDIAFEERGTRMRLALEGNPGPVCDPEIHIFTSARCTQTP